VSSSRVEPRYVAVSARRRQARRRGHLIGIGAAAGIGFTVAIFVTELAFTDPTARTTRKLAILAASVVAAAVAAIILMTGGRNVRA
jgi:NhaA family Na+:H+ antiporter